MLIYGKQPVYYLLEKYPHRIETLYLAKELEKKEYSRLMRMGVTIKRIPPEAAQKMAKNGNHQGFLADIDGVEVKSLEALRTKPFIVILSGITDVGNIGAIIRSAYALGVDGIVVCGIKHLNLEAIVRSSSGAIFDMPIAIVNNVHDVLNDLKTSGYYIYGAVMDGEDINGANITYKRALVLGNESEGLSNRVVEKLDYPVSIKMAHGFDSLNVSAAGAILMDRMR
ncbi:23S rRNA (guanosine(2251)-2'-O)-methyltransferase RlmB [Sulfurimonas sp. HSL3-7]|uniref:23S rRNA (guanosine(2251)-2'-O)-methyltransferase RlmB n=1 Tax=Sulfonitrofixus jiaomeiensis TaxID=3131938 RepID=UPI0031F75C9F